MSNNYLHLFHSTIKTGQISFSFCRTTNVGGTDLLRRGTKRVQ